MTTEPDPQPKWRQSRGARSNRTSSASQTRNFLVVLRDETECADPAERCLHIRHQLVLVGTRSTREAERIALACTRGQGSRDVIAAYEAKDLVKLLTAILHEPLGQGEVRPYVGR